MLGQHQILRRDSDLYSRSKDSLHSCQVFLGSLTFIFLGICGSQLSRRQSSLRSTYFLHLASVLCPVCPNTSFPAEEAFSPDSNMLWASKAWELGFSHRSAEWSDLVTISNWVLLAVGIGLVLDCLSLLLGSFALSLRGLTIPPLTLPGLTGATAGA